MGAAGPRDQHRDHHAADQLRLRQPRPVVRVRGREPQRAGQPGHRRRSATPRPASPARRTTRRRRRPCPAAPPTCWPAPATTPRPTRRSAMQDGYIFDAVLQAGGTVRNYGFLVNNIGSIGTIAAPVSDPFAAGVVQVAPLDPSLASLTDVYFRGYDQNYPDLWRYNEWKREFDQFVAGGQPAEPVAGPRSATTTWAASRTALGGVNTPETQQADDDSRSGRLVAGGGAQPVRRQHADHRHRGRLPGRPRPRRLAPRHGLRGRPLREAGRGGQHALQPGQRAAHHRGHPRHAAHQPEHRVPAADGRRVRHPLVGRLELHRRRRRRCCDDHAGAERRAASAASSTRSGPVVKPKHDAALLGQAHRAASTSPTPTACRPGGSTGCSGGA